MDSMTLILSLFALLAWPSGALAAEPAAAPAPPAHLGPVLSLSKDRGDAVEARYRAYKNRLEQLYGALSGPVKEIGPDLVAALEAARPKVLPHGYQILPKLSPDIPAPKERSRVQSARYSWPLTEQIIEREMEKIRGFDAELEQVSALTATAQRNVYEKLIAAYRQIGEWQPIIDAHVQYNRLWQAAIANDRAGYDRMTALHDAALERQAILDALSAADEGPTDLPEREKMIARKIQAATGANPPPPFLRVEHSDAHLWVIHVPFYTDITDAGFIRAVKNSIENIWRVRDGEDEFRVEIFMTTVSAAGIYGEPRAPEKGEQIDTGKHVALFPGDGAVLTTGAITTHVFGRAIILGPHDIAPRVLAHEFGHILGFKDVYFRGYKDLGEDGFLVMEVIADPDDIMGAPGIGPVLRRHFERVIEQSAQQVR
jgi:hypothetical protein